MVRAVVVRAALGVVNDDGGHVSQCAVLDLRALGRPAPDPRPMRPRELDDAMLTRYGPHPSIEVGEPTVPVRLHSGLTGQPRHSVVSAFARGQRGAAGERLAQRQREIVGFAAREEEPDCAHPRLAVEGDLDELLRGALALRPTPPLVDDRRRGALSDGRDDVWMLVAEGATSVAGVNQPVAVVEQEIDALSPADRAVVGVAAVEAG